MLVIEGGRPGDARRHRHPPDWPELQGSVVDWSYATAPQSGLGGRVIPYPRGNVLGGSSAINALAYQRGHRAAYDRWPEGWRFPDLLPYFKRAETFSGGADTWRGGDGPLHVLSLANVTDRTAVAASFIAASRELGRCHPISAGVTAGAGWNRLSIKGQLRDDAASAYLAGSRGGGRPTAARVLGLVIDDGRCTGVITQIHGPSDVLLCAGRSILRTF